MFAKFDKAGDGTMDTGDLGSLLQSLGVKGTAADEANIRVRPGSPLHIPWQKVKPASLLPFSFFLQSANDSHRAHYLL
jgi:hypothetical protein